MRRRLIKQGIGALTITLPKDWISRYGLKAGDELELEEQGKSLLLRLEGKSGTLRKIAINIDNLNQPLIWRHFIAAYRSGYDEIILKFSDIGKVYDIILTSIDSLKEKWKMETIEMINDVVNRCIGMEIIDQGKNFCVIKDLGETSEREFDHALRRIFLLLISIAEEILAGLEKETKSLKSSVSLADTSIDKFTDFCLRVLNKKGYKDLEKTNCIYTIIVLIEFIADEYKKIALHISESKTKKIDSKLINICEKINKLLNSFYDLFYKFEEKKTVEIYKLDEQLSEDIRALFPKLNNTEKEMIHHLKKIKRYITDLLQLRIELEL